MLLLSKPRYILSFTLLASVAIALAGLLWYLVLREPAPSATASQWAILLSSFLLLSVALWAMLALLSAAGTSLRRKC